LYIVEDMSTILDRSHLKDVNPLCGNLSDHHKSYFVLYHSYLLEYCCSAYTNDIIWCQRPIGYAHLVNASIRIVDVAQKTFLQSDEITQPDVDKPSNIL
jgi:hypothetical protein